MTFPALLNGSPYILAVAITVAVFVAVGGSNHVLYCFLQKIFGCHAFFILVLPRFTASINTVRCKIICLVYLSYVPTIPVLFLKRWPNSAKREHDKCIIVLGLVDHLQHDMSASQQELLEALPLSQFALAWGFNELCYL